MAGPIALLILSVLGGTDWPMRRHDPILSGKADAPGQLREAPRLLWSFSEPVVQVELEVTPGEKTGDSASDIEPSKLPPATAATMVEAQGGDRKRKGRKRAAASLVDLHGDGRLLPDPGKAAALVPGVKGLQTVSFEPVPGAEATLSRKAVCYAHDQASPRVIWTSEVFDTVQNTNHVVADIDADGQLDVVLAPHYRVIVLDGATGRTKHVLRFHDLRNYGFFAVVNLDQDPQLEMVVIADFVLHIDVIDMDSMGPRLLWRHDFEEDIQSKRRILRPGPDPVVDMDGDGRKEILFNLYGDARDGRWHVVALDALTGERRMDLPERYLEGHHDLDGDGKEELLVVDCPSLFVPRAGAVQVLTWRPNESPPVATRWSQLGARFLTIDEPLPLTRSTIVARGTETAAIVGAERGQQPAFMAARLRGEREVLQLVRLNSSGPVLEVEVPAGHDLSASDAAATDEDGAAAFSVSVRARWTERLRAPESRGASVRAVSARPVTARPARGMNADGWIAIGNWGGKPSIFAENEVGEVLAFSCKPGGAPNVTWRERGRGPVVLADVDGDGVNEAIFADESANGEGCIVVAGPTGRKWTRAVEGFPGPNPSWNYGGVTQWWVGRFSERTRFDLFVSARRGTMHTDEAFLLRGTDGALLWQRGEVRTPNMAPATRGWGCGGGASNAVDVDGDGLDDLLSLYPVNFSVLKGSSGELLRSVDAASGLFAGVWGAYATPCARDLDGDGQRELLWSGPYHQGVTNLDGKPRWFHKGATSLATLCDLDGDGRIEAASTGWEAGGKGLRVLDAVTGELRSELALEGNPRVSVTAAQVDGVEGDDLLFATGATLHAVTWREGALRDLWSLQLPSEPLGDMAFADTDGDGLGEVVFVGRDGVVYCYGAKSTR